MVNHEMVLNHASCLYKYTIQAPYYAKRNDLIAENSIG